MGVRAQALVAACQQAEGILMPHGLTPEQRAALDFISKEIAANDSPPTYQEIALHLGLRSKSGVGRLLNRLEDRGHITRLPGRRRSIAVVDPHGSALFDALPPAVADDLRRFCSANNESPTLVVADAVTLFLDGFSRVPAAKQRKLEKAL
jgi:SOS-response transcriptional repressor LexA